MYKRIKEVRTDSGLNQLEFGSRIGASRDTIANIEGNRIAIRDIYLVSICREFNVNEDWLRTGNGDKYIAMTDNQKLLSYINKIAGEEDSSIRRILIRIASLNASDIEIIEKAIDLIIGNK